MFRLIMVVSWFVFCCGLEAQLDRPLTLEEKVGQILVVHFNGEMANQEADTLIREVGVGGIIYYNWANGLYGKEQVAKLSTSLQDLTKTSSTGLPLLLCIDQEGGRVRRLKEGFSLFPSQREAANLGAQAENLAYSVGKELREVGINCNFSPVVDVDSNPNNPIIGDRSFGKDPYIVIERARQYLQGYSKAGVLHCLKHFPGHGDVDVDSHKGLPKLNKSLMDMEQLELYPFQQLASETDLIMTAHMLVPVLDPTTCVTLSSKALSYLRHTIGFEGVIITDSLVMEGVLAQCGSIEEATIRALNAGADLLLLGGRLLDGPLKELTVQDVQRIHRAIVEGVQTGKIPQQRVDDAVERVLLLKGKIG